MLKPFRGAQLNFSHPLSHGLIGCWLMNAGTGIVVSDYSLNQNKGQLVNFALPDAWKGGGVNLDGSNDNVRFADLKIFNGLSKMTIVVDIKLASYANSARFAAKFGTGEANQSFILAMSSTTDEFTFALRGDNNGIVQRTTQNANLALNGQYRLIAAWDGGNEISFYRNSALLSSTLNVGTTPDIIRDTTERLRLGISSDGINLPFHGVLGSCFIYNRALSQADAIQLSINPYCMFYRQRIPLIAVAAAAGIPGALFNAGLMVRERLFQS